MARRKSRTYGALVPQPQGKGEDMEPACLVWPAAVYARLSCESSGRDGQSESIEGQIEICLDYVEEHPCLYHEETYVDNGWTGTNTNRPAFQRMLADIRAGRIRAVVVKDFSRFSRDYIEAGNLLEHIFPALGVRFVSVADRYDSFETDGSASSLLIPIKNLINSFYARDISRKVSTAIHARQLAGAYISGAVPYGYIKSAARAHRLEPDPETAATVNRIFQMRTDGVPLQSIADTLQAEGIPCPGKLRWLRGQTGDRRYETARWSSSLLRQMLRNPTYLGHLAFGRTPAALYQGKPKSRYEPDESKWRILEHMHQPLVSQEVFDRAKEIAEQSRAAHKAKLAKTAAYRAKNVPVFLGLLFCGDCGRRMGYDRYHYDKSRMTGSYSCPGYPRGQCAASHTVRQDALKAIVWQTVQDQLALCCDQEAALQRMQGGGMAGQLEAYRAQIQSLSLQLNSRRDRRERLYEDFTDGLLSPEEYMGLKQRYDGEYQQLSRSLASLQGRLARLKKSLSGQNQWLVHIRQFARENGCSRKLAETLVEKLLVYQEPDGSKRVEIRFKFAADRALLTAACQEEGGDAQ